MRIPLFDIKFEKKDRQKFYDYCDQIFDEAYLTNHTFVNRFETEFAKKVSSKDSLFVSNGTAALQIALESINVAGSDVLIPSNTFIATYVAVLNAGANPIICDIEDETFSISLQDIKKRITKSTKAIIAVHIGGMISKDILSIKSYCDQNNIALIEDAAHAHGSSHNGIKAGSIGKYGCFSHFLTKVLTSGEGGSITFNSNEREVLESIRQFGKSPKDSLIHIRTGSNFKVTEFQAALGLVDLERLDQRIEARNFLAKQYANKLKDSSFKVRLAPKKDICSYYKIIITSKFTYEEVKKHLLKYDIPLTGSVYQIPLHRQEVCKVKDASSYKLSDWFSKYHFCPPCFPEISDEQVDFICDKLLELDT